MKPILSNTEIDYIRSYLEEESIFQEEMLQKYIQILTDLSLVGITEGQIHDVILMLYESAGDLRGTTINITQRMKEQLSILSEEVENANNAKL